MARMFPRSIQFRRSPAEVRLFSALKRVLPEEFVVLHHVQWVQRSVRGGARDGEADFVIAHPRVGALVLEVKGGEMRYEAASGTWYSRSTDGREHRDRDPFEQAREGAHSLRRYLRDRPGWPREWGPIGYAVCFPDSVLASAPLPHVHPAILIDARAVEGGPRLARCIEEAMRWWGEGPGRPGERGVPPEARGRPGEGGFRLLVEALAHDLEIRHPLGVELDRADREIIELSARQFTVLSALAGNRRMAISGPAGSGKTLLAVEKARRLAAQGLAVLFTCFNRPLADHLRGLPDLAGVDVLGFHQVCVALADEAGVPLPRGRRDRAFYDRVLPGALEEAAARLGPRYDALVADEAQDFDPSWWLPLLTLLRDPDHGILYVFYDDNQAIYRPPGGLPEGLATYRLVEDWRNTEPIFHAVRQFYRADGEELVCRGPEGPPVETVEVREEDLRGELSRRLHRLVVEEGVSPRDLVVLTPHAADRSRVRGRVGAFTLTRDPVGGHDVRLESIYRFKGLDARAVILCEVDRYVGEDFLRLMYVGCSRARTLLVVLLTAREAPDHRRAGAGGASRLTGLRDR